MTIEPKYIIILLRNNLHATKGGQAIKDKYAIKRITALVAGAERIAGDNRYGTRVAVNEKFADILTGDMLCVSTGSDFPDALAGGVYAALKKAPMFLVSETLTKQQTDYLKFKNTKQIVVFGGTGAVSEKNS